MSAARDRIAWRGAALPVLLLFVFEILWRSGFLQSASVAPPSQIAQAFAAGIIDGSILLATSQTLASVFGGLVIGGGIGLILGILLAMFPVLYWITEIPFETVRPIPSVALIPLVLLIFGLGFAMEITLVAKTSLWPVFFLTLASVRGVKRRLIEFSQLLGMGLVDKAFKIILPAALPGIFVGVRIALGAALIVAVTIEIAANPLGLGYAMMMAQERSQPALMFAYLIWLGVIGWAMNAALLHIQHRWFGGAPASGSGR